MYGRLALSAEASGGPRQAAGALSAGLRPHRGAPEGPESPGDLGGCPGAAAQAALGRDPGRGLGGGRGDPGE